MIKQNYPLRLGLGLHYVNEGPRSCSKVKARVFFPCKCVCVFTRVHERLHEYIDIPTVHVDALRVFTCERVRTLHYCQCVHARTVCVCCVYCM